MRSRLLAAVTSLAVVLALAGCQGLPTSGPVNAGQPVGEEAGPPDFAYIPDPPPPGASPEQIVEGFIAAGSGPRDNWATARQYLAPEIRDVWQPTAAVLIDVGDRALTSTTEDNVTLTVTPEATVDETGSFAIADGGAIPLGYRLAQRADGEWRITQAPDGVVLDRDRFEAVFRSYSIMYFDPSWTYLVPDERWYPATNPATYIAEALVDGTVSPWLAASVKTAFPESLELAQPAVPVETGVAQVALAPSALAVVPDTLNRMQTQLDASLATAGIGGAEMLVDDQVLDTTPVATRSMRVDVRPLVLNADGFGFLSGSSVEPIRGLSDAMPSVDAAAIQVNPDRDTAAVQTTDGAVVRVQADGETSVLDSRSGLVAPSIDPGGYIWSVPGADPTDLVAYAPDGTAYDIADAWPGATEIMAMQVSRDGTRVAALVRDGILPVVWIAGIIRDDTTGVPLSLGDRVLLAGLPGDGVDVGWVDSTTLALVASDGGEDFMIEQPIGGFGSRLSAPEAVSTVAGGNQPGTVRLRDGDGVLYMQRGSAWQRLAADILVLATQQGSPR